MNPHLYQRGGKPAPGHIVRIDGAKENGLVQAVAVLDHETIVNVITATGQRSVVANACTKAKVSFPTIKRK